MNQAAAIGTSFLPSRPIQYDLNGNLMAFGVGVLDGQSGVFTYDSENRMTSATVWAPMLGMDGSATMGYDPAGRRDRLTIASPSGTRTSYFFNY